MSASNTNAKTIKLQMKNYDNASSGTFTISFNQEYYTSIKVEEVAQ